MNERLAKMIAKRKEREEAKKKALRKKKKHEYYLAHKVTKPKKRKRRKKVAPKEPKQRVVKEMIFHKIILTSLNKKTKTLLESFKVDEIMEEYNRLLEENKDVKFPTRYIKIKGKIIQAKNEILIIKKRKDDEPNPLLKNDIGQYVEHEIVDKDKYIIIEKAPYEIEDTFSVFGYHPQFQRKDYRFILNELILNEPNKFHSIVCYRNKLVIEHDDDNDMDIIICKNVDDTHRLYLTLQEDCRKYKNIIFKGVIALSSHLEREMRAKIMNKTNWNFDKVRRMSVEH